MEWTSGWFGQMTLAKIFQNLQFVSVKVTGNEETFASNNNNTLSV
jgi:hypothetical protein